MKRFISHGREVSEGEMEEDLKYSIYSYVGCCAPKHNVSSHNRILDWKITIRVKYYP